MNQLLTCSVLLFASVALAQQEEDVQMDVSMPGMPGMNVKVKAKTTVTRSGSPQAEPAPAPAPAYGGDDCGAGAPDPGCIMSRAGNLPMDREEYSGFLEALRGNDFELQRESMVKDTLKKSWLTARQLGLVLELFDNEITRLSVAKAGIAHVVNPKHALKLSTKFENSINASDFTKAVNAQR